MVRRLETRAQFHAMLLLKVPKWANLGTEWKQRLIVVMPRFPSPVAPPGTERLVRTLMVAYKGRDQCVPVCKVWLDGAGELLLDYSTNDRLLLLADPQKKWPATDMPAECTLSMRSCPYGAGIQGLQPDAVRAGVAPTACSAFGRPPHWRSMYAPYIVALLC